MVGMKNIQELVRARQLEILKAVESAVEQQEAELWEVRKSLLHALRVVNRLLEVDEASVAAAWTEANATGTTLAPPRSPAARPVSVLTRRYEDLTAAPVAKAAGDQLPTA